MEGNILCSVLVACYNHEKFIEDVLKSIYEQTYENIELIVCDDCSIDNSWMKIQEYLEGKRERFADVKLIRHDENQGLVAGLLEMLELSSGVLVKDMAGDDIFGKTYFEDVVQAYLSCEKDTVLVTNGYFIGEDDHFENLNNEQYKIFYQEPPDFDRNTVFHRMYWGNMIYATALTAPKEVHLKYGTFEKGNLVEDWELWLRWASTGKVKFQFVNKPDVYYRKNEGSMTSLVKNETFSKRWLGFFESCEHIIDKYGVYFPKEEHAKRKWEYLLSEREMMRQYEFGDEKELLKGKFKTFMKEHGKYLSWRQHVTYYHLRLRCWLRKTYP